MGDSMLYNVLPAHVDDFDVSVALVGVLLSANRFVRLASNPLASWAVQRFGLSKPLTLSAALAVATTVMLGLAHGFALLLLARLLWGVCYSFLRLAGVLVALEESHEGGRGQMLGIFNGGQRLGSLVGVLLGGILFDVFGRAASFLAIAVLGVLGVPAALALKSSDAAVLAEPDSAHRRDPSSARARLWDLALGISLAHPKALRQRLVACNFAAFTLNLVIAGSLVATLGYYLSQRLGDGAAIAGVVIGVATINGLIQATRWLADVGNIYWGHLADSVGLEKVALAAMPVSIAALVLLALDAPLELALPWLALALVFLAAALTALTALAGGLVTPHERPQALSRLATWQDTGAAFGPLLAFALISDLSLDWVYLSGGAILAVAMLAFVLAYRPGVVRDVAGS
jgi:MFS family permease